MLEIHSPALNPAPAPSAASSINPEADLATATLPSSSRAAEKTIACATERGSVYANMILFDPQSARYQRLEARMRTLDRRYTEYIEQKLDDLPSKNSLLDAARVAYDTSVYQTLRSRFVRAGIDLGESQGRIVDHERFERMHQTIETMEERVRRSLPSLPEDQRVLAQELGAEPGLTKLQHALRGAVRQGEKIGIEHRIHAEAEAARLYRAVSGWKELLPNWMTFFKPFQTVCHILQHKTRAMIGYIDQAYQERSGRPLKDQLIRSYGKTSGARIAQLLGGDDAATAAYLLAQELKNYFIGKRAKGTSARQIYEKIGIKGLPRFESILAHELCVPPTKIGDYIAARIPPRDAQKLQALREGAPLREKALDLADILQRKASQRLEARTLLGELNPSQVADFAHAYKSESGESLRHALETKIAPSPARDFCLAIVDQDETKATAAQLKCALEYRGDWIGAPFLRKTAAERQALIDTYNSVYHHSGKGDFWGDLRRSVSHEDFGLLSRSPLLCSFLEKLWWPYTNSYPFVESLIRHGELKSHELLRYFMLGIGTDVRGIYAVLSNRTHREIECISSAYAEHYPPGPIARVLGKVPIVRNYMLLGDLRHDLRVELSGDHEFDISLFCEGLPDTRNERLICATMYDHLIRRYEHERGGLLMRNGLLTAIRGDRMVLNNLERDYNRAISFYQHHIEKHDQVAPEVIKRFCTLARLVQVQADAYREAKVSLGSLILNSGAFIGATLGATATLLFTSFSLWTAAPASACGSLLWRWAHGRLLLGNGFGRTDATFQMIRAFVDGASIFTMRAGVTSLGTFLGNKLTSGVAKSGFKTSLHRFIQSLEERVGHQDKARHLIERGDIFASDEELNQLHQSFLESVKANRSALHGNTGSPLP